MHPEMFAVAEVDALPHAEVGIRQVAGGVDHADLQQRAGGKDLLDRLDRRRECLAVGLPVVVAQMARGKIHQMHQGLRLARHRLGEIEGTLRQLPDGPAAQFGLRLVQPPPVDTGKDQRGKHDRERSHVQPGQARRWRGRNRWDGHGRGLLAGFGPGPLAYVSQTRLAMRPVTPSRR